MTLNVVDKNVAYIVDSINAREDGMREFLLTLGLLPGRVGYRFIPRFPPIMSLM